MVKNTRNTKSFFYNDPSINLVNPQSWDQAKVFISDLTLFLQSTLERLGVKEQEVKVDKITDDKFGDYSTNIAMQLAKQVKQNPINLAKEIILELEKDKNFLMYVDKVEVAGGGFINFFLKQETILKAIRDSFEESDYKKILQGKRIMFEYGQPNPFKSFHIGHLRNITLGESLIRVLEYLGASVVRVNYQGDVGMHIAKSLWAIFEKEKKGSFDIEKLEKLDSYKRMKIIGELYTYGATKYEEDELAQKEIKDINYAIYTLHQERFLKQHKEWKPFKKYSDYIENPQIDMVLLEKFYELGKKWSFEELNRLYKRLYSHFDREYMESETLYLSDINIKKALELKILEESDGAIIFNGEKYGLDTRVFLNSFKLPTYEGKEIGLGELKDMEYKDIDLHIHNVATEQISFFKVTFKVKELLNPEEFRGRQFHNAYEFVGLVSGKMSSRKGKVVLAEDILNEAKELLRPLMKGAKFENSKKEDILEKITIGAVKYSFLNISPFKYLAYDMKSSVSFEGDSGPYLLYTFARGNKIIQDSKTEIELDVNLLLSLDSKLELKLLKQISFYQNVVIETGKQLSPNILTNYLFELAQIFNSFYKESPILNESDEKIKSARLLLTKLTTQTLQKGLYLLGIKTVESM